MDASKLAALRVSRLAAKDKQWLLENLSQEEKMLLKNAMRDMHSISRQKSLSFEEIYNSIALQEDECFEEISIDAQKSLLNQYDYKKIQQVLNEVPAVVAGILLQEADQKFQRFYVGACESDRKSDVERMSKEYLEELPDKVKAGLLDWFVGEIESQERAA